jgi:hypothetical protein
LVSTLVGHNTNYVQHKVNVEIKFLCKLVSEIFIDKSSDIADETLLEVGYLNYVVELLGGHSSYSEADFV